MSHYSYYLFDPLNEDGNKKKLDKDTDNKEKKKDDDEPAWYDVNHHIGRAIGYFHKRLDQGFSKGYGGVASNKVTGYVPHKGKEDKNDEAAWYNPIHAVGKALGTIRKSMDKGFTKGYGGTMHTNNPFAMHNNRYGYDPNPKSVKESMDFKECLYNCGDNSFCNFGKESLYDNDIDNVWYDDDADKLNSRSSLFKGPGDNWDRNINLPAIRAAKITNSYPDNMTKYNGINKISENYKEPFSFRNYRRY